MSFRESRLLPCLQTIAAIVGLWAGVSMKAEAAITFAGSSGSLSASATFADLGGGNLQVTLANTSSADVDKTMQVLTAVFFNVNGNPLLVPGSALLGGSTVVKETANGEIAGPDGGGNVGGEWAYRRDTSPLQYSAMQGISSSGFGIFGQGNFNGPDLVPPSAVNGIEYGITGTGAALYADGIKNQPLIKSSVVFTLSGLPVGSGLAGISDVTFQYGTVLSNGHFTGSADTIAVPEPNHRLFGALVLTPLAPLQFVKRRRQA